MQLYKIKDLIVRTVEREDITRVLELFNSTNFNCDSETASLRPADYVFEQIMEDIINGDKENQVLVLKKNNKVIGYLSCYIEYSVLHLGHIVVDSKERNKEYGYLLTKLAMQIASNDERSVALFSAYNNSKLLDRLGFKTHDGIHYYWKGNIKNPELPNLFLTIDEYDIKAKMKMKEEIDSFSNFLENNIDLIMSIGETPRKK